MGAQPDHLTPYQVGLCAILLAYLRSDYQSQGQQAILGFLVTEVLQLQRAASPKTVLDLRAELTVDAGSRSVWAAFIHGLQSLDSPEALFRLVQELAAAVTHEASAAGSTSTSAAAPSVGEAQAAPAAEPEAAAESAIAAAATPAAAAAAESAATLPLHASSIFGQFTRRVNLAFKTASFEQIIALHDAILSCRCINEHPGGLHPVCLADDGLPRSAFQDAPTHLSRACQDLSDMVQAFEMCPKIENNIGCGCLCREQCCRLRGHCGYVLLQADARSFGVAKLPIGYSSFRS